MFRLLFVIFFSVFSLVSVKSSALEVNDLYRVIVAVEDQTLAQREKAITKALQGVFVKIGGKKSVLKNTTLVQSLRRPNKYINQYRYQRQHGELSLVVSFNEDKVNQLFKQAELPLWGSLRPQVLLWLIDEQGLSRHIVAYDENTPIPDIVNQFSLRRGLPILMPLMDLTDNQQVVLSDLWGYFPDKVQQTSQRYYADTVVVMRVSDSSLVDEKYKTEINTFDNNKNDCGILCADNQIETAKVLDWKAYTQGVLYIQRYKGNNKEALITQGLSDITELIYETYALSNITETDFVIEVNNVSSLKSDTQLFDFLSDLSGVNAVTLISAQGDVRRFKLDIAVSQDSFLAMLKLNNKLTQQLASPSNNMDAYGIENILGNEAYSSMKVVMLGVAESSEDSFADNDASLNDDLMPDEPISTGISSGVDTQMTKGAEEAVIENVTPLTITPNVPVFYWEKG